MEEIIRTTRHTLFKLTHPNDAGRLYKYYYVRTTTDGIPGFQWNMGYKNHKGFVSFVGGELTELKKKELESEYLEQVEFEFMSINTGNLLT